MSIKNEFNVECYNNSKNSKIKETQLIDILLKTLSKYKFVKIAKYHHIELYGDGGESNIDNIMVLCKDCHDEIHRTKPIEEPIVEEDYDDEDSE